MVTHDRSIGEICDTVYEMKKGGQRFVVYVTERKDKVCLEWLVAEDDHAICIITTKYDLYSRKTESPVLRHGEASSGFINFRYVPVDGYSLVKGAAAFFILPPI